MTIAELCRELKKYPENAEVTACAYRGHMHIFCYSEAYNEIRIYFPKTADADFLERLRKVWKTKQ